MKKVATIIVTYNGEKWIQRCLETVVNSSYASDLFVVDNCSSDYTVTIVKNFPVHLDILDSNSGFGFANNFALNKLQESDYDYFFLINQDLYLEKNSLETLIDFSLAHPEMGIIAPIQYDGEGRNIDTNFQQYISHSIENSTYFATQFCNAAAWLITRECLNKVGLFNPMFPHYGEDRNYCERATFHKIKIAIVKNTKVLHDRAQKMTSEKAIKLAKIKLLTIFLNPNNSASESKLSALKNVFGIAKYLYKKNKSLTAVFPLMKEYLVLLKKQHFLEIEKNKQK